MANEMETLAGRLATFDLVLHPDRRSSSSKSAKPISWPHSRPSPAELAHAGFFYNPYETNPDNTTCFLCRRALDGWEEEDNPITEHLKHAPDCGWAVMMDIQQRSSNPAEIEDPTSERISQARLSTFGESWPHEGKKGWLCQPEKMAEGGWFFCPNEESADLASCAYCNLSLDGWEPKDNPFDEHYRRSSDCSFFVFAKPAKGKGSRSKKARTSKASRLSTQSTASEIAASDVEDLIDQSVLSQSTKTKTAKKSTKSKSKSTKSKTDESHETESQMELDGQELAQSEPAKPKRATRGKKRPSADVETDNMSIFEGDSVDIAEPPTKKRATKSRTSRARAQSIASTDGAVEAPEYESDVHEDEDRKTSRGSKKRTSRSRKGSVTSSTSKAASKSRIPRDSELEAAIEAGLEADEPQNVEPEEVNSEKTTTKSAPKKSKTKKKTAKKDPEPPKGVDEPAPVDEVHTVAASEPEQNTMDLEEVVEQQEPKPIEVKTKRRSSKKKADQPETQEPVPLEEQPQAEEAEEDDHRQHESFVSVEIISKPPPEYSEIKFDKASKKPKKKSSEKAKKPKKPESSEKAAEPETEGTEMKPDAQPETLDTTVEPMPRKSRTRTPEPAEPEQADNRSSRRRSSKVPPKTAERYSDIPHEKQYAKSLAQSTSPEDSRRPNNQGQDNAAVSPLPSVSRGSPSLSPQSSDAENHPPSLRASTHRAQISTPSKPAAVRCPLAATTPSPSKRNASAGNLQTSHPWVPINVEQIVLASASDKENAPQGLLSSAKGELTSPEKKMTVEEWIMWNAKNGEERLKQECERLVGQFELEGARAMRALEGIECTD
ncbi:hypothetical protein BJY04DRAFT_231747 [Aspergillus karnatakaensis]|uniref:uncharacterized protein n=1 Tax=Aspergillus karnatakaensis TaxID=1810916 RepID=UPI003CCC9A59